MHRLAFLVLISFSFAAAGEPPATTSAEEAMRLLITGNKRYAVHKEKHPHTAIPYRKDLSQKGQHPYAAVLGCADSRVPPELIFDAGLGDLFVMRVAGNVVDDDILGSLEYAVEHLGVHLIVVLGHEKCGAVTAALQGGEAPGHIANLVKALEPAVAESKKMPGDAVHNCVVTNARRVAEAIRESGPILKEMVHEGKVKVVAADYSLDSGLVEFLDGAAASHSSKAVPQHK